MPDGTESRSAGAAICSRLPSLRDPRYTGPNRCWPCTAVNTAIAALIALGVGAASPPAGVVVFAVALLVVALRGYLIPGTPTLTKRYLPERVLRWFDKDSPAARPSGGGPDAVEAVLVDADALVPCDDDLCLDDSFRTAWRRRMRALRETESRTSVAAIRELVGDPDGPVSIREHGGAYAATVNGDRIGQWESLGAYLADVAASQLLADRYPHWEQLSAGGRMQVLAGLRLWLEECPECDGPVALGQDTVESCCRSVDVVALTCRDCGDRLFEAEYDPSALA